MKPETHHRVPVDTTGQPIISIKDLSVHFAMRGSSISRLFGRSSGSVKAVDGINLDLAPGEVVGLVGESGSGKSTLGRAVLGMAPVTGGTIEYRGREISALGEKQMRPLRKKLQMIFQDPHASLNPSMTVGESISDALRIHGLHPDDRPAAVAAALERVGLAPASRFSPKYPTELSGGQKQRAVIARAICLGPELLVADEPISMLDMSVRAKILGLLDELRTDLGLTFIYITHDLASARFFCDRVAIMYLGRIVEIGPTEEIFSNPRHPYTKALLAAVPDPDPSREIPKELPRGEVPDAAKPPAGCPFHPRCPAAFDKCGWEARDLRVVLEQRWTSVDLDTYEAESKKFGDLTNAETTDDKAVVKPGTGTAEQLLADLSQIKRDNPAEPFFSGVRSMAVEGGGVKLEFKPSVQPELLPIVAVNGEPESAVSVACHLYH